MKKLISLLLAATLLLSLAACSNNGDGESTSAADETRASGENTSAADETRASGESTTAAQTESDGSPLALLNSVWAEYGEDEKFPANGGGYEQENFVSNAPGEYSIDDKAMLSSVFGVPEASAELIASAASIIHMMNANMITCGAFKLKDGADEAAFAEALKNGVLSIQWICGFPDTLVIYSAGGCIVSAFGYTDNIDTLNAKLTQVFPDAELLAREALL